MAGWHRSSCRLLDGSRELIERQILRTTDLERFAPQGRIRNGALDERRNVGRSDEIDGIVAAAEHEGSARLARRLLEKANPGLEERGCPDDRPPNRTAAEVLFGRMLHAEQLHRA